VLSVPEKDGTAADGGAAVFSGQTSPKLKLFKTKLRYFFILVSNPRTKSPKSLPKRLDRSLNGVGQNLSSRFGLAVVFLSSSTFSVLPYVCECFAVLVVVVVAILMVVNNVLVSLDFDGGE
jgi:hypothetical protein